MSKDKETPPLGDILERTQNQMHLKQANSLNPVQTMQDINERHDLIISN